MANEDGNFKDPIKKSDGACEQHSEDSEDEICEVDPFPLPTNQDYMSYYVYQNEWKPTKPIRSIGAMWANPGPAIVNLPPTIGKTWHDPTKAQAPAYTIGRKHFHGADQGSGAGPGPGMYNTQGLTNMGKDSSKGSTMGRARRFRGIDSEALQLPGPASFNREFGDRAIYRNGPAFSMPTAKRVGPGESGKTPGPNAYTLPTAFGPGNTPLSKGPAFSIGKSRRDEFYLKSQSPGPAHYMLPPNDTFMNKSPAFHMASRARPSLGESPYTEKPGPHAAHLVKFDKYSTPRITFGIRHSPYKVLPGFAAEK